MTTAPLEPEPGADLPGSDDEPFTDPSSVPDGLPEPEPDDDTVEAPL